jgi:hypothetical protein
MDLRADNHGMRDKGATQDRDRAPDTDADLGAFSGDPNDGHQCEAKSDDDDAD